MGSIKESIKRFFLGKVSVKGIEIPMVERKSLEIFSHRRSTEVFKLRADVSVAEARFATWNSGLAKGHRFDLFISPPKAKGSSLLLDFKAQVSGGKVVSTKVQPQNGIKSISSLPQRRRNLASYTSDKKRRKEILALFYPVIKECVVKSALEKESGWLYVWYNPSCYGSPHMLCLVPDPGKRPPLAWRWL